MTGMKCLLCVAEHKLHSQTIGVDGPPPEQRDAITLCNTPMGPVTPICYEHLEVTRASSLLAPAPAQYKQPVF